MRSTDYVVDPATGCWVWQRARNQRGYGNTWRNGRHCNAHRAYYEQLVGAIPEGLVIDHLCRNNACVNPEHLEAVSQAVNVQRGAKAKLTVEIVAEIRVSTRPAAELASQFGVHVNTIYQTKRGDGWAL